MRMAIVIAGLACLLVSCGQHQMIPASDLKEIQQLAFDGATKRYVRSDAWVQSEYEAKFANHSKVVKKPETEFPKTSGHAPMFNADNLDTVMNEVLGTKVIAAVAAVKGVQLNPSTPRVCLIKFDFEPSDSSFARLPENEAAAQRFERPDGSHYWVIVWK